MRKGTRASVPRNTVESETQGAASRSGAAATSRATPLRVVVSLTLAVALLAFFLWRAPLADVAGTLARVHPGWVAVAVVLSLASYAFRALRWGAILQPVSAAPTSALLGCTAAGFAISTLLPGRIGELVRPLLLSRRTGLPAAATLASILAERLIDLATLLALFAGGVMGAAGRLAPTAGPAMRQTAALAAAALLLAFLLVFVLLHFRASAVPRVTRLAPLRWRERLGAFLDHLLDGLEAVRSAKRLALLAAWSTAVWGAAILQIEALARGFGLSLGLASSAVLISVSVIGLAVPTPGGVGSFHAAVQFALAALLSVELADATAFAIVHHAVCFFPITVAGLGYMGVVGLRPSAAARLAASDRG